MGSRRRGTSPGRRPDGPSRRRDRTWLRMAAAGGSKPPPGRGAAGDAPSSPGRKEVVRPPQYQRKSRRIGCAVRRPARGVVHHSAGQRKSRTAYQKFCPKSSFFSILPLRITHPAPFELAAVGGTVPTLRQVIRKGAQSPGPGPGPSRSPEAPQGPLPAHHPAPLHELLAAVRPLSWR